MLVIQKHNLILGLLYHKISNPSNKKEQVITIQIRILMKYLNFYIKTAFQVDFNLFKRLSLLMCHIQLLSLLCSNLIYLKIQPTQNF